MRKTVPIGNDLGGPISAKVLRPLLEKSHGPVQ